MKNNIIPIIFFWFTSSVFCQSPVLHKSIENFYEDLFKIYKMEITMKYKDEATKSTVYKIRGIGNFFPEFIKEDNTEIFVLLQSIDRSKENRNFILMEIHFQLKKDLNPKEKFDLVNRWAQPDYPASVYWEEETQEYILSITEHIIGEGTNYHRLTDRYIGLLESYKQLKKENQIK